MKRTKARDLDFPDTSYKEPGATHLDTVKAMRDVAGDRRLAATRLGISMPALKSRLSVIRGMQKALEDKT